MKFSYMEEWEKKLRETGNNRIQNKGAELKFCPQF